MAAPQSKQQLQQKRKNSELSLVPESVLKKAHDLEELKRKRAAKNELVPSKAGKRHKKKNAVYVIKPETILAQSRSRRNAEVRYKRVRKKGMQKRASNQKVTLTKVLEPEHEDDALTNNNNESTTITYQANSVGAPMVFAVRIRDNTAIPSQVKQALGRLRLKNIHDGVFVNYNKHNRKLLHLVEPWVVYGPPSAASVQDLIERRGFAKIDNERVPLSDNTVIEKVLGDQHNILCVEDLVHELTTAGEAFEAASKFLWPFQLSDSKTIFERRTLKLKDGKEYGDLGERIQEYIQQVL